MTYQIENKQLRVSFVSRGGELTSILSADGTEYLWQPDKRYWTDQAPNIFPYVARLTDGTYLLDGKKWRLPIHGFVPTAELEPEQIDTERCAFVLHSSAETKEQYPFDFIYRIVYSLSQNTLTITYQVENLSDRTCYFGLGGHPGFRVPIDKRFEFSDYYLEFIEPCSPERIGFSDDCFVTQDTTKPFALEGGTILRLRHDLFDDDAIVLKNAASGVYLRSGPDGRAVRVDYPGFPYLGIWHMPKTDAPYVCIEPWASLPSRKGIVENLATQPGLIHLNRGERYEVSFSVRCY